MKTRAHAPAQTTTSDPDRVVAVIEAHLGERLAVWQVAVVVAILTPRALWSHLQPFPVAGEVKVAVRRTYGACSVCGWTGKITGAGGVRRHRSEVPGSGAAACPGTGKRPA